jgi:hypothetical protein
MRFLADEASGGTTVRERQEGENPGRLGELLDGTVGVWASQLFKYDARSFK